MPVLLHSLELFGDNGVRRLEIEGGLAEPIDIAGVVPSEYQKSGRDQILTSPGGTRDNAQGNDSGAFGSDVVAVLRSLPSDC